MSCVLCLVFPVAERRFFSGMTEGKEVHLRGTRCAAHTGGNRLLELALGYGLILAVLWTPPPWQRRLYLVAALFLLAASVRPREGKRGLGLALEHGPASALLLLLTLAVAAVSALAARHLGAWHAPGTLPAFANRFWGYALWSLAQQFLLQNFFLFRLRRLIPGKPVVAVGGAAVLFSAAHLPNPVLTPFTLVWGSLACLFFLRYRNLWALGLAHAVLGITVAVCLPGATTHNMHVGLGYWRWNHRDHRDRAPERQRSVKDHTVSTSV